MHKHVFTPIIRAWLDINILKIYEFYLESGEDKTVKICYIISIATLNYTKKFTHNFYARVGIYVQLIFYIKS